MVLAGCTTSADVSCGKGTVDVDETCVLISSVTCEEHQYLDKLIDELVRGKKFENIKRK